MSVSSSGFPVKNKSSAVLRLFDFGSRFWFESKTCFHRRETQDRTRTTTETRGRVEGEQERTQERTLWSEDGTMGDTAVVIFGL